MEGFEKRSGKEASSPVLLYRAFCSFASLHSILFYEYIQYPINGYSGCYILRFNKHLCTSLLVDICFDFS